MTARFITDAYTDRPTTPRAVIEHEIKRLKVQHWADPGDSDLRARIAELEAELGGARCARWRAMRSSIPISAALADPQPVGCRARRHRQLADVGRDLESRVCRADGR